MLGLERADPTDLDALREALRLADPEVFRPARRLEHSLLTEG
jgi:hypothetical protein